MMMNEIEAIASARRSAQDTGLHDVIQPNAPGFFAGIMKIKVFNTRFRTNINRCDPLDSGYIIVRMPGELDLFAPHDP